MLQYKRRGSTNNTIHQNDYNSTPLLTYCNWSYAPEYHIDLTTLQNILRSFNDEYIPFYLRIFNETPNKVVKAFLEQYEISKKSLEGIYQNLLYNGMQVKNNYWSIER